MIGENNSTMSSKHFLKRKTKHPLALQKQHRHGFDLYLLLFALGLAFFGLIMIFNVSAPSALAELGDKFHYLKEQGQWLVLSILTLIFFSFFDYRKLYYFALPLLLVTLVALVAVFLPGIGTYAKGAARWINLGFFNFQPTEFAKISLIIYLSAWFTHQEKGRLLSFLTLLGLVLFLVVIEPDLGTAGLIAAIFMILYFLSGAPLWHFLVLVPIILGGGGLLAITSPYRFQRVLTFFNPTFDPQGASYHLKQVLLALGSGGWFGLGLGKSRQKFAYLPEASTDSIFAIIAEEVGFLGATVVITAFVFLIYRGFMIAFRAPDRFGRLLGAGLSSALAIQIIVNLGTMVSLIPLTGVPLPFLSYGGSSLVVSFAMVGILLNISRQT